MSSESAKRDLRKKMNQIRSQFDSSASGHAGSRIADAFGDLREFNEFRCIALYASALGEPDTRPLFELLVGAGRDVLLPRCVDGGCLDFVKVEDWSTLKPGRFGLLEPAGAVSPESLASVDLFLIPGLAFDRRGARLGRGGGYYDRSLPHEARVWGLAFEAQWVGAVPTEEHDRSVDGVLTEAGLTRTGRSD